MMIHVLMAALLAGAAQGEICLRTFGGPWGSGQVREVRALFQAFRVAIGDDARQAHLLRCGRTTLRFGLITLALVALLAVCVSLPPWLFRWTRQQELVCIGASSVFASMWWVVRRRQANAASSFALRQPPSAP